MEFIDGSYEGYGLSYSHNDYAYSPDYYENDPQPEPYNVHEFAYYASGDSYGDHYASGDHYYDYYAYGVNGFSISEQQPPDPPPQYVPPDPFFPPPPAQTPLRSWFINPDYDNSYSAYDDNSLHITAPQPPTAYYNHYSQVVSTAALPPSTVGTPRYSVHLRRATGGKKKAWRKKRKYDFGSQPAPTKLASHKTVRRVRVRGGHVKWRLDASVEGGDWNSTTEEPAVLNDDAKALSNAEHADVLGRDAKSDEIVADTNNDSAFGITGSSDAIVEVKASTSAEWCAEIANEKFESQNENNSVDIGSGILSNNWSALEEYGDSKAGKETSPLEDAAMNVPSIIFIDASIVSKREKSNGEVERSIVSQFLSWWVATNNRIIGVGCGLLPPGSRIHNVFHVSLLKKFVSGTTPAPLPSLPSEFMGARPLMPPLQVLARRTALHHGAPMEQVLVDWSADGSIPPTWEPVHTIAERFPYLLEDKEPQKGEGVVTEIPPAVTHEEVDTMHEESGRERVDDVHEEQGEGGVDEVDEEVHAETP